MPETLPSHASMFTGLYPAGHGVHENARVLARDRPLAAELLQKAGYRTAAFVSSFVLARRFGLARGFDVYDDELPAGRAERSAAETTERALAYLARDAPQPLLLWVHYYDPHYPYSPPEPFRTRFAKDPYRGEVAAMDAELGRLRDAFERRAAGPAAILVVGDHGEGLGEHGESQHGRLLYQATMRVPLLLVGPRHQRRRRATRRSARAASSTRCSTGRGSAPRDSLRAPKEEIVLGEAMKPFLAYGWQPQVMAVEGRLKVIQAGRQEVYDVVADPREAHDLGASAPPLARRCARRSSTTRRLRPRRRAAVEALGDDERRKLASLGYVSAGAAPVVRKDAPRPADMSALFDVIERASLPLRRAGSTRGRSRCFEKILAADAAQPRRRAAARDARTPRSGTTHARSTTFDKAATIAPGSQDVLTYRALHYARGKDWQRAVPLLEQVLAEAPDRLPALEALAVVRERQGRLPEARRAAAAASTSCVRPRRPSSSQLGQLAMSVGQTRAATDAFERARRAPGRRVPPRPRARRAVPGGPAAAGRARRARPRPRLATRSTRWRSSSARR